MAELTEQPLKETKNRWLYGVIGLLAFLLTVQTGAVVYYLAHRENTKNEKLMGESEYRHEPAVLPAPAYYRQRQAALPQLRTDWNDPFFDDAFSSMGRMVDHMNRLLETMAPVHSLGAYMPDLDLEDTGKSYVVRCDLPGLDKDQINISVQGTQLAIQGVKQSESQSQDPKLGFYAQERSYGSFSRSLTLPGPVDETKIQANYEKGVLTIELPKASQEESGTKKIQVQ